MARRGKARRGRRGAAGHGTAGRGRARRGRQGRARESHSANVGFLRRLLKQAKEIIEKELQKLKKREEKEIEFNAKQIRLPF